MIGTDQPEFVKNKRCAIDIKIINQRLAMMDGRLAWTNTLQQVADGLTRPGARQRMGEVLRHGTHAIRFDPSFTAGRKTSTAARQAAEHQLDLAAAALSADAVPEADKDSPPERMVWPSRTTQESLGLSRQVHQVAKRAVLLFRAHKH